MKAKTQLVLAMFAALGLSTASALATTNSIPADLGTLQGMDISNPFGAGSPLLSRRGQDDVHPEDAIDDEGCDNHGVDGACLIAKRGSDHAEDDGGVCDETADNNPCA